MKVQKQVLDFDKNGRRVWRLVEEEHDLKADTKAVLLCDIWDGHWCRGAVERLEAMVPAMNDVLTSMRSRGALIIHAPSDTLDFYVNSPARLRCTELPQIPLPSPMERADPPLPIDDSDGGADTDDNFGGVNERRWSRQHPGITIDDSVDLISDSGEEVLSALREYGIETVIFMGVHTNMCVLHRSFGIKNLVRWGVDVVFCRDLTDAMYNPALPPYVSHEEGTGLVIQYIEKHWCPTTTSGELKK